MVPMPTVLLPLLKKSKLKKSKLKETDFFNLPKSRYDSP
jgi:hypothetical protein